MSTHALQQLSLKLVMLDDQDRVLCLRPAPDFPRPDLYDLPGGRMHEDEGRTPLLQALEREIREEMGMALQYTVEPAIVGIGRDHLLSRPDTVVVFALFTGRYTGGEIALSHEHSGYEWIPRSTLNAREHFVPGIADALEMWLGQ